MLNMSRAKSATNEPVPKSYPSTKTIILREKDNTAKKDPDRPGVWSYNLNEEITLKDGDEVLLKSSFVDTQPNEEGLINITKDDIAQLSITTGLYWSNAGNGVSVERYQDTPAKTDAPTYDSINYSKNGPLPLQSQVLLSEDPTYEPNAKNYICQNAEDQFTNLIIYLNTGTAQQNTSGGAVSSIESPPTTTGTTPGANYFKGTSLQTTATTGNGSGLRVDINGVTFGSGEITSMVQDSKYRGEGYAVGDTFQIIQPDPSGGAPNQTAVTKVTGLSANTTIALELVPNSLYDPTKATHEYNDYTLKSAENNAIAYEQPPADPTDLVKVAYLSNLKIGSDPADPTKFLLYSARFSGQPGQTQQAHDWTKKPNGTTNHIATITITLEDDVPTWTFLKNDSWDRDAELTGGDTSVNQGWIFAPSSPGGNITFNTGSRAGLYRICLGMWLWVWDPYTPDDSKLSGGDAWPSKASNGHVNNYNLTLHYYQPGTSTGNSGYTASKPAQISKEWIIPPSTTSGKFQDNNQMQFYDPQFTPFADRDRSGFSGTAPFSDGFPAPASQFPIPVPLPPTNPDNQNSNYPVYKGGTFLPCWFGDMPDTSSSNLVDRDFSAFPPFVYDANPSISLGATDPDAKNFAPFRVTTGNIWQEAAKGFMDGYETAGIVQQDARGPVVRNAAKGKPDYPPVPYVVPPLWTQGAEAKQTTAPVPPYKLTHECVLSKPYLPGGARHLTARTFTTKLIDIPGVETTLQHGTYTYAEWARILTDTINRVPRSRPGHPAGGTGGLSNNPDNPNITVNRSTYSQSRTLTDTVQLGYQGLAFPSNRVGLPWNTNQAQGPDLGNVVAKYDDDGNFLTYENSIQPYWVDEDVNSLFAWKDNLGNSAVEQAEGLLPADYASVDPQPPEAATGGRTFTYNAYNQHPSVYGENGPKWAGAESFSIIFNDASQAFEIVQMHSNLYDAESGAIITRQFRSGPKGSDYPQELGEFNIADQSGGVFITDWQPKDLWENRMGFSANTLVHTGGDFSSSNNFQVNSFLSQVDYPNLSDVSANKVNLVRGTNITGNFRSLTGMVDKRVNIPDQSGPVDEGGATADKKRLFIGGNFASCPINFDLQTEVTTPVTILGKTIVPGTILDPFFMIELSGINRNELYGLPQNNKLISQVVGRYYTTASYTEGSSDGSITYVHRGEPMMISELGIRILDSGGAELGADEIKDESAIILQINSTDVSLPDLVADS